MISVFGGASEGNETPRETAIRELHEETNLETSADELEYFLSVNQESAMIEEPFWSTHFLLQDVDASKLEVYEGQGYVTIPKDANLDDYKFTPNLRKSLEVLTK